MVFHFSYLFFLSVVYTLNNNNSSAPRKIRWRTPAVSITSSWITSCNTSVYAQKTKHKNHYKSRDYCIINKYYVASPYEQHHARMAQKLEQIDDFSDRQKALISFVTSEIEINAAKIWLNRVKIHMEGRQDEAEIKYDHEYLSKFVVTQKCGSGRERKFIEWIEPLTLHARNPFSFLACDVVKESVSHSSNTSGLRGIPELGILNVDHILLTSRREHKHGEQRRGNSYLLDAGTARYDSSLWWLVCAYMQVILCLVCLIF